MLRKNDINWQQFLFGSDFEEITNGENKIWIIVLVQSFNKDIEMEIMFEVDNERRQEFLTIDSYIVCSTKKKRGNGKLIGDQELRYIAYKYNFIEKVIDNKNNLIIIAEDEEVYEYDYPKDCDDE